MSEVTVTSLTNLQNKASYGEGQTILIDEPKSVGGAGAGPDPYTLLLSALGGKVGRLNALLYAFASREFTPKIAPNASKTWKDLSTASNVPSHLKATSQASNERAYKKSHTSARYIKP
jgi:hypothetical protein